MNILKNEIVCPFFTPVSIKNSYFCSYKNKEMEQFGVILSSGFLSSYIIWKHT